MKNYSQNDPAWKKDYLGTSKLRMGDYGCVTADVAEVGSYFGDTITPKDLAAHHELYTVPVPGKSEGGLILWNKIGAIMSHTKFLWRYFQFDEKVADEALITDPNKCIIFRVNKGLHWVMALKKVKSGYVCHNPYPFPAVQQIYKFNAIDGMATFTRNVVGEPEKPVCAHCCPVHCPK